MSTTVKTMSSHTWRLVQRDVELIFLCVVCIESVVMICSIEQQSDSFMGQQEKHTIAFQSNPLKEYIDRACSILSPHFHNGRWFLLVGQDREIDQ